MLPYARAGMMEYFQRYNCACPHQTFGHKTPKEVYFFSQFGWRFTAGERATFLKSVA
jgi:hypothetical protein